MCYSYFQYPLLQHVFIILFGNGTYTQCIGAGSNISKSDSSFVTGSSPAIVESFQLPGI